MCEEVKFADEQVKLSGDQLSLKCEEIHVRMGHSSIYMYLDLTHIFHTTFHRILLKPTFYGFWDKSQNWIGSYLSGRRQFVSYDGSVYDTETKLVFHKDPFSGLFQLSYISMIFLMYPPL